LPPGYEQKAFPLAERRGKLRIVADRAGTDGAVTVHQDAKLFVANLGPGEAVRHILAAGRGAWVQVARGVIGLNDTEMREGDGAAIEDEAVITIEAETDAEVLLFDLG
jgi:quercetin 2,3-dioxygenase